MTRIYNPEEDKLLYEILVRAARNFQKYGTSNPTEEQIIQHKINAENQTNPSMSQDKSEHF